MGGKPAFGILELSAAGQIEFLRWNEAKLIPVFITLSGLCFESKLKGKGTYFLQRSTTRVIVRLVQ